MREHAAGMLVPPPGFAALATAGSRRRLRRPGDHACRISVRMAWPANATYSFAGNLTLRNEGPRVKSAAAP
jgi:hypothetical protein